jgi:fatty acid desaturase
MADAIADFCLLRGMDCGAVPASTVLSVAAIVLCTLCIALHSSLQHEVTHGHPFNERRLGECWSSARSTS